MKKEYILNCTHCNMQVSRPTPHHAPSCYSCKTQRRLLYASKWYEAKKQLQAEKKRADKKWWTDFATQKKAKRLKMLEDRKKLACG